MKELKVEMLGGLSVFADGVQVHTGKERITKPWKLFCMLLIGRKAPIPTSYIIDVLWGDAEIEDYANTAKNAVYMLRRQLEGSAPLKNSVILFKQGGYMLNPALDIQWDCDVFFSLCEEAANEKQSVQSRVESCKAALALCKGDFLPTIGFEQWALPFSMLCQKRYIECAHTLEKLYFDEGKYADTLHLAENVTLSYPLDEESYVFMFRAMEMLEFYAPIITTYYKISGYFEEELGTDLCAEIREIYTRATERTSRTTQDMAIIREDLRQQTRGSAFHSGGFYCDYGTFKALYQMVARMAARSGGTVMLLLLDLVDSQNRTPARQSLAVVMAELRERVRVSLRRSDTFAKYSANQYIIMLQTDSPEKAQIATLRILNAWKKNAYGTKLVTKLSPVGPDESVYFSVGPEQST